MALRSPQRPLSWSRPQWPARLLRARACGDPVRSSWRQLVEVNGVVLLSFFFLPNFRWREIMCPQLGIKQASFGQTTWDWRRHSYPHPEEPRKRRLEGSPRASWFETREDALLTTRY